MNFSSVSFVADAERGEAGDLWEGYLLKDRAQKESGRQEGYWVTAFAEREVNQARTAFKRSRWSGSPTQP
jgi:hypothetical protein